MSYFFVTMFFGAASNDQATALLLDAATQNHLQDLKAAIAAGADVNAIVKTHSEVKGFTALHLAAFNDCESVAAELCKHPNIRINATVKSCGEYKGYTPLQLAAMRGYAAVIKELIKHRDVQINGVVTCDGKFKGFTPLHLAIIEGYRFAVIELLQHQAIAVNAVIKNDGEYDGLTPLGLAVSREYFKISEELLKHNAILQPQDRVIIGMDDKSCDIFTMGLYSSHETKRLRNTRMGTSGFWGIIKNGEEKMIFNQFDSYPEYLGKEVVCLIQNNLESLNDVFDKIIFVKNINSLDPSEAKFILIEPGILVSKDIKEKYFSVSAKNFFEHGGLEYGYMIDLDRSVLKLYKDSAIISEVNLDKIKYKDIAQAFRDFDK